MRKAVKFEKETNDMDIEVQNDKGFSDLKLKATEFDIGTEDMREETFKKLMEDLINYLKGKTFQSRKKGL